MAESPTLQGTSSLHLIGAGGAGMSALAKLLSGRGFRVTGSDLRASETLSRLGDLGLEVWTGHDPARAVSADLVVASSAVPDNDPEVVAAREAGIPVWDRPRLLAAVSAGIPTIGPTGTHGKTSSAAMLVHAARAAGIDPSFVVGGDLIQLGTNAGVGDDDLLILEVDEAFRTFEAVRLEGLVVTNIEPEHLDHFDTVEAMEDAFTRVVRAVEGPVVMCLDDPGASRVAERTGALTYGTSPASDWRIESVVLGQASVSFRLAGPSASVAVDLSRPGIHMARNAAGVLSLLAERGVDVEAAASGLAGFRGVRRRFEHRGTVGGITVIDDYAHHPTEVAATLRASRRGVTGSLWAVFQPHLYSRTEQFQAEFGSALALADRVVVTDVYPAREVPRPGVTGELVADAAVRAGAPNVDYVPHLADVPRFVADRLSPGDTVITMGAGDITIVPTELLTLLRERPA